MNVQTGDRLQGGFDVFRKLLTDGFKHFLEVINISDLISSIFLQPGKDFFEPCLSFL
jgi:hypothetical protein